LKAIWKFNWKWKMAACVQHGQRHHVPWFRAICCNTHCSMR
jgi:hypothetical protein